MCVYLRVCMLHISQHFSIFSWIQLIERMVEIYTLLYIHLCKHKIPHSFDHCDCIIFRLYVKLLSTHGRILAYCAIFLNKLV